MDLLVRWGALGAVAGVTVLSAAMGQAEAQEQIAAATGDGPIAEILVTTTRIAKPITAIPNTVRVVDTETLKQQLAFSSSFLDGLGSLVPSFSPTRQKLSTFGETFRGRKPLFLIDGVPQSTPLRDGSRESFTIDTAAIDRVEVIYGANAIQGVGATGGIINYVTKTAPADGRLRTDIEASITADTDFNGDGFSQRLSGFAGQKLGRFDVAAAVAIESRGRFYDGSGRPIGVDVAQGELMDSDSWNLFLKTGYDLTDSARLQVMANAFNLGGDGDYVPLAGSRARGLPTTSIRGVQGGRPAINRVRTLSVDFTDDNLFGGILRSQFFIQDFESVFGGSISATLQDAAIAPIGTLFDQSSNNSDKIGAKLSYARQDIAGLGLEVVAGVDLLRDKTFQALVLTNRLWVPETVFRDAAPFLQVEQTLFDQRLRLSGGVRYEIAGLKVDDFRTLAFYGAPLVRGGSPSFEESLFNVGAVFTATDAITAYASVSDGFTMPDVGRILREINRPGVAVESFLNLQPVLADNIEVGTTYATDGVNVELSYFWSSSALGQRLVPDGDGIFRVTREKTKIHGFEGSVRVNATDALSLGANYAHLNGRFDSNGDGRLDSDLGGVNISPNRLNVFADWAIADAWSGRVQLAHLFDRTFVGPGAPVTFEGYTTVDASVGWTSEEIGRIDLAVQNLFNRDYITYFSQTNNLTDNLRYFAGRGRTITLRYANSF